MSQATIHGTMQFGLADDATATGLLVGSISWSGSVETALAPNHLGCSVGIALYEAKKDVTVDGIIKTKGTGILGTLGTVIVLANTTSNSRTRNSEGFGVTPDANAGIIVVGNSIAPTATGMEGGGITGIYLPSVSTNAPVSLS